MCTTGSEDAVTVQSGTFSWDRNEKPVLKKCVCVCEILSCGQIAYFVHNVIACSIM